MSEQSFRTLCLVALADGELAAAEKRVLIGYARRVGLPLERAEGILREVGRGGRFLVEGVDPAEREALFEAVVEVACADDRLPPSEQELLRRVGDGLDVPEEDVQRAIRRFLYCVQPGSERDDVGVTPSGAEARAARGELEDDDQPADPLEEIERDPPPHRPPPPPRVVPAWTYMRYLARQGGGCGEVAGLTTAPVIFLLWGALAVTDLGGGALLVVTLVAFGLIAICLAPSLRAHRRLTRLWRDGVPTPALVGDAQAYRREVAYGGEFTSYRNVPIEPWQNPGPRGWQRIQYIYRVGRSLHFGSFRRARSAGRFAEEADALWVLVDPRDPSRSEPALLYWL